MLRRREVMTFSAVRNWRCERALFAARELSDPDSRPDLAGWMWDTEPMRRALARLDFPAVLVIYRSAARLSRRELAELTGVSHTWPACGTVAW